MDKDLTEDAKVWLLYDLLHETYREKEKQLLHKNSKALPAVI